MLACESQLFPCRSPLLGRKLVSLMNGSSPHSTYMVAPWEFANISQGNKIFSVYVWEAVTGKASVSSLLTMPRKPRGMGENQRGGPHTSVVDSSLSLPKLDLYEFPVQRAGLMSVCLPICLCLSLSHISLCQAVWHSLCVCSDLCGFVQSLGRNMWLGEVGQPQVKTRTCTRPREGRCLQGVLWAQGQGCFYIMAPGCWGASVTQGHLADMVSWSEVVSCGQQRLGQSVQRPWRPWLSCLFPQVLPGVGAGL